MNMPPVHRPRVHHRSGWRRVAAMTLAGAVLALGVGGCFQSPPSVVGGDQTGPVVAGLFEFEFTGIGTDAMSATVRRLDVPGEVSGSALGTQPVTGINIVSTPVSAGYAVIGGNTYLNQTLAINNTSGSPITGLTFIAYSGPWALQGSAFRVVAPAGDANTITPAVGTRPVADSSGNLVLDTDSLNALSTVMFDEAEPDFVALNNALTPRDFVSTVLPYGFVATNAANLLSRSIPAGAAQGRLSIGFKIPNATTNQVIWRAVAIIDSTIRIGLPSDYNTRGAGAIPVPATGGVITDDGGVRTHTFTDSGTFTVLPAGDGLSIDVFAVGGGGGGGSLSGGNNVTARGGGGGAFAGSRLVVDSDTSSYAVTVGAGGVGNAGAAGDPGNPSAFGPVSDPHVRAAGGQGGSVNTSGNGGLGGSVDDSIGDESLKFRGGNGVAGGGGGAGTGGAGGDASGVSGGAGRAEFGGDGGTAVTAGDGSQGGFAAGGGGSGFRRSAPGGFLAGGTGAPGIVVVRYRYDPGTAPFDNLQLFVDRAAAIADANGARVEVVVIGAMPDGQDRCVSLADDVDGRVLRDVRIAGPGPATRYWLGGEDESTVDPTPFGCD